MRLGIIGAGNMAKAIVKGISSSSEFEDLIISVSDCSESALSAFDLPYVTKIKDNKELAKNSDIVFLAVKPVNAAEVFKAINPVINNDKIIISIMAGVKLAQLKKGLSNAVKFVRCMPNLAAQTGNSMNALCMENLTKEEAAIVRTMVCGCGLTEEVPEDMFDIVTAVSGSGPAYFVMFIDAVAQAAIKRGMTKEQARKFAAQTALGAAYNVLRTDMGMQTMVDNVCSKGGTTIEAVNVLQGADINGIIDKAVDAAYKRSKELSTDK